MPQIRTEAAQFLDDPEMADLALEIMILIGLMQKGDIPGAMARIEGWGADETEAACLLLAQAAAAHPDLAKVGKMTDASKAGE